MKAVICDGCGRQCYDDAYATILVTPHSGSWGAPPTTERDYCLARDGGSVGCAQKIMGKLDELDTRPKVTLSPGDPPEWSD